MAKMFPCLAFYLPWRARGWKFDIFRVTLEVFRWLSKAPFDSWSIRRIQVDPRIASKSILAGSWFTGLWEQMILPSFLTWVILNWILLVLLVEISCFYVYFHVFLSCIKSICLSFLVAKTNRKFTFPLATFQSPMTKIYARIIETLSWLFAILATAIQLHRGCRKKEEG